MKNIKDFSLLVLLAVAVSMYGCKDMGSDPSKPALTASVLSVTLAPGGQTLVTISGGHPPYTIREAPNVSLATATLSGSLLTIQATSANVSGTTRIKIVDTDPGGATDSPSHEEQEIVIEIRISSTSVLFSSQVQPIFTNSCVSGCHTPGGSAPFSLASGQSRANLVDVNMQNGACGGKRVVAGNPSASGLVKKLEGSCGNLMPLGGSALPASQITLIRDWITQGAQGN